MRWPSGRLADLSTVITKGTTPTTLGFDFTDKGIVFLRVQNISGGGVNYEEDTLFIDERTHETLGRSHIRPGDVLISIAGTIGRSGVVPENAPVLNCNQAVAIVRTNGSVFRPFLRHWLATSDARSQMRGGTVTGTISNLSLKQLGNLELPLPPLAEQRRIATILDKAEELRTKRRSGLAQLDLLTQAIFFDFFGLHKQTSVTVGVKLQDHPEGWKWELLTEVARLATGHTPDRRRPHYWNGDIPWITLSEIRRFDGMEATQTAENISEAGLANSSAVKLPQGTVCFSRTASVGFVTMMGREMATSQDFVNWVCGPRLHPMYLMHALLRSREWLRSLSTGSTHKTIYFPIVEQFRVLVPPLSLQHEFARCVAAVEKLKTMHRTSLAEMDSLFASLQHRAFRGEL